MRQVFEANLLSPQYLTGIKGAHSHSALEGGGIITLTTTRNFLSLYLMSCKSQFKMTMMFLDFIWLMLFTDYEHYTKLFFNGFLQESSFEQRPSVSVTYQRNYTESRLDIAQVNGEQMDE